MNSIKHPTHASPSGTITWELTYFPGASEADFFAWKPENLPSSPWLEAKVPGAPQTTPGFGLPYPEILYRKNWESVRWMDNKIWAYRIEIPPQETPTGKVLVIRFLGLDYHCRIFLNRCFLIEHEGMFSPVEIELNAGQLSQINTLHLAFLPSAVLDQNAASTDASADNVNASSGEIRHLKARYMKGWDFCPELKCCGIWDEAELEWRSPARIEHVGIETRIANAARADVFADIHILRPEQAAQVTVHLAGAKASVAVHDRDRVRVALEITNPELWHPHTHGNPALHSMTVNLYSADGTELDSFTLRVGLREISRRAALAQTSTDTPAQYLINSQPVFLCGANLTPFSSVPAELKREDYLKILQPLRQAGVNFLRVWGGGLREKRSFYDLCDEMGFLVMQEFPLACQIISCDPGYLRLLAREGRSILRQLKHHACIAVWSGGNEHYHFWEACDSGSEQMLPLRDKVRSMFGISEDDRSWRGGISSDHPALQILHSIVAEEAPLAFFNITSGLEDQGETHGPWNFRPEIGDHRFRDMDFYEFWSNSKSALHSEASVSGPAHPQTFAGILGAESLKGLPVPKDRNDPLWIAHKAFKAAWDELDDNWLDITGAEQLVGDLADLDQLVRALGYLQGEGTRFMIESVRRRQGRTSGLVWWGINEPFPSLAGNALIDFHGRIKPALKLMQAAFRPHLLSFEYPHLLSDKLRGSLFFTNSTTQPFNGSFTMVTRLEDGEPIDHLQGSISCDAYSVVRLLDLTPLPLAEKCWASLDLTLNGPSSDPIPRYRIFNKANTHPLRNFLLARGVRN